jgi:hypothetical protein
MVASMWRLGLATLVLTSCSSPSDEGADNPVPVIMSITPALTVPGFVGPVTLTGTGFIPSSRVRVGVEERTTTYVSPTSLTFVFDSADVADENEFGLTVVNGPPGGGSSRPVFVLLVWKSPTLTDVSPDTAYGGYGATTVVLRGTEFRQGATYVLVGVDQYPTTVLSDTVAVTSLPEIKMAMAGPYNVQIFHYGTVHSSSRYSTILPFMILNPTPVVSSLSPQTVFVGTARRVAFIGSLFHASTQVFWNGSTYPTSVVSPSLLYADLPSSAFTTAGSAAIAVRTPGPGGGTSNGLTLTKVIPPPSIAGFTPSSAQAGASDFSLTIRGRHFYAGSALEWNGASRTSTLVNDSTMTVTVTASDLVDSGSAMLRIVRTDDQESQVVGFPIVEPAFAITDSLVLDLLTTDLVADPSGAVVYFVVRDFAEYYRNEVVAVDTSTGQILWHLPVGPDPRVITISDDGAYLYVGYSGTWAVSRVNVATRQVDLEIPLPDLRTASDIAVFPGHPTRIAVSRRTCCANDGLWVYDGSVQRPLHGFGNQVELAPDGERVYGHGGSNFDFFRQVLTANGLIEDGRNQLLSDGGVTITYDSGLIFSSNGRVMDPEANVLVGTLPGTGYVRPDVANGRVHRLSGNAMTTYHLSTFEVLGSLTIGTGGASKMVRFGTDGMAFGAGDRLVLIRSPLIG